MKKLGAICLVAAVVLGWLEHMDRASAIALTTVEWSQRIGIPLYALATLLGIVLLVAGILTGPQKSTQPIRRTPYTRSAARGPHSKQNTTAPSLHDAATLPPLDDICINATVSARDTDWRSQVRALAQDLQLGKGARVTIDMTTTTPITLHLEHLSPSHCKRAISAMGSLVTAIPTPPRMKIVFDHCPETGGPRHHQVAGALSQTVARGQFRVVSHVDAVDVMFLHPDPAWSAPILHS